MNNFYACMLIVLAACFSPAQAMEKEVAKTAAPENLSQLAADSKRDALVEALELAAVSNDLPAYKRATANFYRHRRLFNSCVFDDFERVCVSPIDLFACLLASIYGHTTMKQLLLSADQLSSFKDGLALKNYEPPLIMERIKALIRLGSGYHPDDKTDNANLIMDLITRVTKNLKPEVRQRLLTSILFEVIKHNRNELGWPLLGCPIQDLRPDVKSSEGFYGSFENANKDSFCGSMGMTPLEYAQQKHNQKLKELIELALAGKIA